MKKIILLFLVSVFISCESVYYPMTYTQIQQIKKRMSPAQLKIIRGEPMKISVRTMGRNHPNGVWQGLVYCYALTGNAYDLFYFDMSSEPDNIFLVEWELNCNSDLCRCDLQ
jgi:hypothetical protein